MPHEFARLTPAQVLALPKARTVFFFAVGPLEDHGPHLPLGLDLLEASELCRRAAERLEREMPGWVAVILPPAPLALDSNTGGLALTVRAHVLRDWLVDACQSLIRTGFFHFVCFSGHLGPRQLTAIEEAGGMIYRSTRWIRLWRRLTGSGRGPLPALVSASSALVSVADVRRSPVFLDPSEHGGRRDTSVALALGVAADADAPHAALPERPRLHASKWARLAMHLRHRGEGYWGRPAEATPGWGEGVLKGSIDEVFPKLRAMLEGADPNLLFRSWYSLIPTNRTFFKAWLLALSVTFILLAWVLLNLWTVVS